MHDHILNSHCPCRHRSNGPLPSSYLSLCPSFRDGDIGSGEMEVSRPINRWQIREGKEKTQSRRLSLAGSPCTPSVCDLFFQAFFLADSYNMWYTNLPGCVCHERPPMNIFLKERGKEVGFVKVMKISDKIFANYPLNGSSAPRGSPNLTSLSKRTFCVIMISQDITYHILLASYILNVGY